jgi:hypothetical protein
LNWNYRKWFGWGSEEIKKLRDVEIMKLRDEENSECRILNSEKNKSI